MKHGLLPVATIALGAAAFSSANAGEAGMSAAAAERLANYTQTGETTTCLSLRSIRSIKALDEKHFLVTTRNKEAYLNVVSAKCNNAHRANFRIEYTTSQSQLCRHEIIRVVDNSSGIASGSCSLGDFERLEKKADPEAS